MKKIKLLFGFILILLLMGCNKTEVKEFNVEAFRFGYKPDLLTVNKGDKVRIEINNIDTLHGIKILELGVSGDEIVEFTADKRGKFTWYCNNYCGSGHREMSGKIIVK